MKQMQRITQMNEITLLHQVLNIIKMCSDDYMNSDKYEYVVSKEYFQRIKPPTGGFFIFYILGKSVITL